MTLSEKNEVLKSGKISSITRIQAIEWVDDLNKFGATMSAIGCVNIDCSECSMYVKNNIHDCKNIIINMLKSRFNISGFVNGAKFEI